MTNIPLKSGKLDKRHLLIVLILIAAYVVYFSWASIFRYKNFLIMNFDFAIGNQILHNLMRCSMDCSIRGGNFLGDHLRPVFFLYLPFYSLCPGPVMICVLQSIVLGAGAVPVFLIARMRIGAFFGVIFAFLYLFSPIVGYINLFEFHPEVAVIPFTLFAVYYFLKKEFGLYLLFGVLSLSCKENVAFIIFLMGVWALFDKRGLKWYAGTFLLGLAWFLLAFYIIIPFFNKSEYPYLQIYGYLGNSFPEMIKTFATRPLFILKILVLYPNLKYLFSVFVQFGFLPLLSPLMILPAVPQFLQMMLTFARGYPEIYTHYNANIVPFMFVGSIMTVSKVLRLCGRFSALRDRKLYINTLIAGYLLFFALASNWYYGPHVNLPGKFSKFDSREAVKIKSDIARMVPKDVAAVASFDFLPVLSSRASLYSFHYIYWGYDQLTGKAFSLPDDVEYALIDFDDPHVFWTAYSSKGDDNMRRFFNSGNWRAAEGADMVFLFRKGYDEGDLIYEAMETFIIQDPLVAKLNDRMVLLGYDLDPAVTGRGKVLKLYTYYSTKRPAYTPGRVSENRNYGIYQQLMDSEGNVVEEKKRPVCYGIYPNIEWKPDEVVKELSYFYIPENIPPGKYTLRVGTYESKINRYRLAEEKKVDEVIKKHPGVVLTTIEVK
ncbi:DUF2079 domain-containing protein [Candidatus Auribacterota bacterium]